MKILKSKIDGRIKSFIEIIDGIIIMDKLSNNNLNKFYTFDVFPRSNNKIINFVCGIETKPSPSIFARYGNFQIGFSPSDEEFIVRIYRYGLCLNKKLCIYIDELKKLENDNIKINTNGDYFVGYFFNNDKIIINLLKLYFT